MEWILLLSSQLLPLMVSQQFPSNSKSEKTDVVSET